MINKKLLLLSVGLLMTTQMIFSQVPSYVPTNGLVGYWPFNGNANDQSVNGLNGIINGPTLTTDRFGNINSAYSFENANQYITLPSPQANTFVNAMSFSLWYKEIPNADFQNIFDASGKPLFLSPNSSGIRAYYGNSFYADAVTPLLNSNNWKHIFVIYEGQNISIYINGNLITSETAGFSTIIQYLNTQSIVGSTFAVGGQYAYVGKVDDIAIWNRALTPQEITAIYNQVPIYSDTCNAVSGSLTQGLVGYWPFCGNANDDSGNGNNGTVNGATLTTDRFGNSNSAYSFNGVNNFISCLNNNIPAGNSSRTFSAWFYLTPTNGYSDGYSVLSYGTNTFPDGRLNDIFIKENEVEFNTHMNYSINTNPLNNNNLWHNIVVVYNNTNVSSIIIYLDGIQIQTSNFNLVNLNTLNTLNTNLLFGKSIVQYASNFYFNGKIDDIGIWNRALTQQEITQLYNQNQCITNITVTDTLIINLGQLSFNYPVTYANNITIYPNPANTQVNISFNNISDLTGGNINIINSLGQQVATTPITLSGTNTTMPLNTWGGTGLYFVQILNAQGIVVDVKKIILQ